MVFSNVTLQIRVFAHDNEQWLGLGSVVPARERIVVKATSARRRLASLQSLLLALGVLVAPTIAIVVAVPPAAHASVSAGDAVASRIATGASTSEVGVLNSSGDFNVVSTGNAQNGTVSANGAMVAFDHEGTYREEIWTANSDGSGRRQVTPAVTVDDLNTVNDCIYEVAALSSDGSQIAYNERCYPNENMPKIYFQNASGPHKLTAEDSSYSPLFESDAAFSPDGSKAVFAAYVSGTGYSFYIADTTGSATPTRLTAAGTSDGLAKPTWIGDKIYYTDTVNGSGRAYYVNADNTGSPTAISPSTWNCDQSTPAADGNSVICTHSSQLYNVYQDSGGTWHEDQVSSAGSSEYLYSQPAQVQTAWPPTPPSNSTVALSGPSPSDAPYTRQITIGLSATGADRFQYGWSTSSSTAPNTSYLQSTTDLTNKKGTLNFLGKYSGSGTTWNGGTQPDQDWYLWVRPANGGTSGSWGTPLKVHTPKKPVWVAVGDSFTSGHHQDADEPLCPDPDDVFIWGVTNACTISGAPHVHPNDETTSWVYPAVVSYDSSLHLPSAWSWGYFSSDVVKIAQSGAPTSSFGASGATPGTSAWASAGTQMGDMRAALYPRPDSWNIVSVTGGADDTNWVTKLKEWYNDSSHWSSLDKPWMMDTSTSNCPDSNAVYSDLQSGSPTLHSKIQTNLQGVVDYAASLSPGLRVLNVGYPYVLDSTDYSDSKSYCNSDHGSWKGFKSVVDDLNGAHTSVTGSNVKYVDLTASSAFGTSPVHNGYIETFRYYGYPHPTITAAGGPGEGKEADATVSVLTGSGW
jgi:hypothetical protein